jgi:hypothetical protein
MPWAIDVDTAAGIAAATLILWAIMRWQQRRQMRCQLRLIQRLRAQAEARIERMKALSARAQSISLDDQP